MEHAPPASSARIRLQPHSVVAPFQCRCTYPPTDRPSGWKCLTCGTEGWSRHEECHSCHIKPGKLRRHHCRACGFLFCSAHIVKATMPEVHLSQSTWACKDCVGSDMPTGGGESCLLAWDS